MPSPPMKANETTFDIIRFTPDYHAYHAVLIDMSYNKSNAGKYLKHTEIHIPMGVSRYGGPVVDMPPGIDYPENLLFAAQLDLSQFAPFDKSGLLPKSGQLIFFADIRKDTGRVIYADIPNNQLIRTIKEHDQDFFLGNIIAKIYSDTETLEERFIDSDDPDYSNMKNAEGKIWDDFAGREKSKIFGIYTDCQLGQEEIEEITFSSKVLLIQIGEDGFNDEGVFSVLIEKDDLKERNFDNCILRWSQS